MDGIKHNTHPLLAGRRRFDLEENIEKAFNVKVYMHAPTVKVFKDDPLVERHYDRIYVTGELADVQKTVAALQKRVRFILTTLTVDYSFGDLVQRCRTPWKQNRLDYH
jgi:hypothetical protein